MIKINLLPPEKRTPKWAFKDVLISFSVSFIIICFLLYGYNAYRIWSLETDIKSLNNQYQSLIPIQQKMSEANSKQKIITLKNQVLDDLKKQRKPWHLIIKRLGNILESDVWLTEVSPGDKGLLKIKGEAFTYVSLAAFLTTLAKDEYFAEPVLIASETSTYHTTKFEITVKIKGM